LCEELRGQLHGVCQAGDLKEAATPSNGDIEARLYSPQVLLKGAAEIGQAVVVSVEQAETLFGGTGFLACHG
jgi:hypothetical protein